MHEPGKHVGPSRGEWDGSPGSGPLGGSEFSESDLDRLWVDLKAPDETCPAPGFYARVMDRVDAQRSKSIWSVFLQPIFGRRLAVASGVVMLILGAALLVPGSEVDDQLTAGSQSYQMVDTNSVTAAQAIEAPDQDKNAVLVNLVTYQEH
jgi:hypothetical protein